MSIVSVQAFGTEVTADMTIDEHVGATHAKFGKPIQISVRTQNQIVTSHYSYDEATAICEKIATLRLMTLISNDDLARLKRAAVLGAQYAELYTRNGTVGRFPREVLKKNGDVDTDAVVKFCRDAARLA